jgi:hypothetical protein
MTAARYCAMVGALTSGSATIQLHHAPTRSPLFLKQGTKTIAVRSVHCATRN